jgi:hypothetical protein
MGAVAFAFAALPSVVDKVSAITRTAHSEEAQ